MTKAQILDRLKVIHGQLQTGLIGPPAIAATSLGKLIQELEDDQKPCPCCVGKVPGKPAREPDNPNRPSKAYILRTEDAPVHVCWTCYNVHVLGIPF